MAAKSGGKAASTLRDHRSALENALSGPASPVVVFGECGFLRSEAVAAYRAAWRERYPDGDGVVLRGAGDGRPASLSDILAELSGGSLFARDKLVVVRQGEKILFPASRADAGDEDAPAGDRERAFLERLEAPPDRIWLLLETAQLPRNRKLGKRLAEICASVPCPQPSHRELPAWLSGRARRAGKTLDDEACDLLIRAHGGDLGVLAGEIDKLSLFAGDRSAIDAAMAREFLTGTVEFDIFAFTNAVEARDAGQAGFYARRIAAQGARDQRGKREDGVKAAHRVLSMLAGTVRGLVRARVAAARRLGAAQFAAAEKISPWRAERLMAAANRFSPRELRRMAAFAADQMRRAHDTGGDAPLSLEVMAVRFTAKDLL